MIKTFKITLLSILLTGCTESLNNLDASMTENHPTAVSRTFWNIHIQSGLPPKNLLMTGQKESNSISHMPKNQEYRVTLGKSIEQGGRYFIMSTLTLSGDERQIDLPFYTIVGSSKGKFKIYYDATIQSFFDAIIKVNFEKVAMDTKVVSQLFSNSLPNKTEKEAKATYDWAKQELQEALDSSEVFNGPFQNK